MDGTWADPHQDSSPPFHDQDVFDLHRVSYHSIDSGLPELSFDLPYEAAAPTDFSGAPIEYMSSIKSYSSINLQKKSGYLCINSAHESTAQIPSSACCLDGSEDHASSSLSNYDDDKVAMAKQKKVLSSSKAGRDHALPLHRAAHRTESQRFNHILAERQRREEMNEKFSILKTILPKLTKKDKASIVTDTINYVRELEKEVKYLQDFKSMARTKGSKQNYYRGDHEIRHKKLKDIRMVNDEYNQNIGRLPQIELQNMGSQSMIKLVCPRSRGLVLRTHKALVECRVEVLQSNVTTLENNAVHYFTVQLKPGVSASNDEIISALEEAISNC